MVTRQLHDADTVTVSIRLVHAHADKRQLAVSVLGIDARTFGFNNKPGFLQEILVPVKDSRRYLHQTLRLFEKRFITVRQRFHAVGREYEHVQVDVTGEDSLKSPVPFQRPLQVYCT